MANYCNNQIRLEGDPDALQKIYDKLDSNKDLNLDNYWKVFETVSEDSDIEWDSKWTQISNIDWFEGDDLMFISADSAWDVAYGFWQKLSEEYGVDCEVTYSEPGENFAGKVYYQSGKELGHDKWTYWEFIYEEDDYHFWDLISDDCSYQSLDDIKESLGDLWDRLSDGEIQRIKDLLKQNQEE